MVRADWHVFQVLTKRSPRLTQIGPLLPWSDNIWMGVTIEDQDCISRLEDLRACEAKVRFLSLEPLLGPLPHIDLAGIDWVIVGGESGLSARPLQPGWVRQLRDRCLASGVPFFLSSGAVSTKRRMAVCLMEGRGTKCYAWLPPRLPVAEFLPLYYCLTAPPKPAILTPSGLQCQPV